MATPEAWTSQRCAACGLRYGYSVWVPGLVVGVAYAAAAWAKLNVPPGWTDWVLNGTVEYHFIGDSVNAPVDWGLQFARFPFAAILASFGVVAIEAGLVTAAFVRNEWYRLTLGVAALLLFSGFYLFMGVFWPAWWILLLSFLPWRRLGTYFTTTSRRSTTVHLHPASGFAERGADRRHHCRRRAATSSRRR